MVVIEHDTLVTGNDHFLNADYTLTHRRFPSIPQIKDNINRGKLLKSQENLLVHGDYHGKPYYTHKKIKSGTISVVDGREPSIMSTVISPTVTRKTSQIKRRKGRMMNYKEFKSKFFYPVNAPKRRLSRNGKYRNHKELNATMDYINIDSSISKDLCVNQYVKTFDLPSNYVTKFDPKLKEYVKAITIDSNNNYIIYTPNPTVGENSFIEDAEQRLDEELVKLGSPISFTKRTMDTLPEYSIHRLPLKRYDTIPMAEHISLRHTNSLPTRFKDEKFEALWNLYLRRVIAERIKWRLLHSNQPDSKLPPSILKRRENQKTSSNESGKYFGRRRFSGTSSVDTNFFLSAILGNPSGFPIDIDSPSSGDESRKRKKHGRKKRSRKRHNRRNLKRNEESGSEPEEPITDAESALSSTDGGSPRSDIYDSLEELMFEMSAIIRSI